MKFHLDYDIGDGNKRAVIGVQAQVGWELRTKKKIGSIAEGYAVSDMAGLLFEQLRIEDHLPEGVVNEAGLVKHLVELDVIDPDEEAALKAAAEGGQNGVVIPIEGSASLKVP